MGNHYTVSRTGTALSLTNDYLTLICPSTRALKIKEIRVAGGGTASAAAELLISRSTGGVTGGGAITPVPLATLSPASGCTVNTTWGTQPTIGVTIRRAAFNANGALNPIIFMPGQEIEVPPSGQLSFRGGLSTSLAAIEVAFEEIG
jgi:hypothetical protein